MTARFRHGVVPISARFRGAGRPAGPGIGRKAGSCVPPGPPAARKVLLKIYDLIFKFRNKSSILDLLFLTVPFVCRFSGSVGIRIAYSACFKTLPHVLTYTVQYWVVFINMFHTAHPICGMGQCNGPVFATCRLRNLSAGVSEDAGVLENVTYLLVAPDMWHG